MSKFEHDEKEAYDFSMKPFEGAVAPTMQREVCAGDRLYALIGRTRIFAKHITRSLLCDRSYSHENLDHWITPVVRLHDCARTLSNLLETNNESVPHNYWDFRNFVICETNAALKTLRSKDDPQQKKTDAFGHLAQVENWLTGWQMQIKSTYIRGNLETPIAYPSKKSIVDATKQALKDFKLQVIGNNIDSEVMRTSNAACFAVHQLATLYPNEYEEQQSRALFLHAGAMEFFPREMCSLPSVAANTSALEALEPASFYKKAVDLCPEV